MTDQQECVKKITDACWLLSVVDAVFGTATFWSLQSSAISRLLSGAFSGSGACDIGIDKDVDHSSLWLRFQAMHHTADSELIIRPWGTVSWWSAQESTTETVNSRWRNRPRKICDWVCHSPVTELVRFYWSCKLANAKLFFFLCFFIKQ